jgi:hypothetical protein
MKKKAFPTVLPFLAVSMLALVMGLWAGLVRMGWALPALPASLPMQHGPLMVSGFLGTLIALERVAAIGKRWMYGAPLFSGSGWVLSLAAPGFSAGPLLITLGSLFAAFILLYMVQREPAVFTITMAIGALCWLAGNILWVLGMPVFLVVWWWAAFLVLTIAGERLELSRVRRLRPLHYRLFGLAAGVFLLGVVLSPWLPEVSARITGAGMLALSAWLLRYDIARRNMLRATGLPRYIATCLFTGYLWLGAGGILHLLAGPQAAGPLYDAVLHMVFVGFVLSMIFGHAPIILPALARIQIIFHPGMYLPLALLHGSLVLRIAGDLLGWAAGRKWGGLLNEVALLGFLGWVAVNLARQKLARTPAKPASSPHPVAK